MTPETYCMDLYPELIHGVSRRSIEEFVCWLLCCTRHPGTVFCLYGRDLDWICLRKETNIEELEISVGINWGGGGFDPLVHVFNPLFVPFCHLCWPLGQRFHSSFILLIPTLLEIVFLRKPSDLLIDWSIDWLIDWLVGWLVGWLIDWLIAFIYYVPLDTHQISSSCSTCGFKARYWLELRERGTHKYGN